MTSPRPNRQSMELGNLRHAVDERLAAWRDADKIRRLWEKDASIWTGGDEARWLGWLDVIDRQLAAKKSLENFARDVSRTDFRSAVVLGMGGSSLCPEVLSRTFGSHEGFPELFVLDSTVPASILALESRLELDATLFIVASKSGTTAEPHAFEKYFFEKVKDGSRFIAITDPGSALEELAHEKEYRHVFHGEPAIGGRFSALSSFGMGPAGIMGLDVVRFLESARTMAEACGPSVPPENNPGVELGLALGSLALMGRDKLTLMMSGELAPFGAWLEQLVAESTGKMGKGILPVDREAPGPSHVYGDDRVFVELALAGAQAELPGGHPHVRIALDSIDDLPQEFFRWEIATAVAGAVLELNPFDQPDVEASKAVTRALAARYEQTGSLPSDDDATFPSAETLRAHLELLSPGDYFAIQAYIEMNRENDALLQSIRERVRNLKRVATTVGYGPRFLHSTGQLHKGGPNSGVFLQITSDDATDAEIPGHRYSFGNLKWFQSQGDLEVLRERGRRVLRVHLGSDVPEGLERLAERIA